MIFILLPLLTGFSSLCYATAAVKIILLLLKMVSLKFNLDLPASSHNVLLCGCGGGCDIYTGLPLYKSLVESKKNVFCANITFSDVDKLSKIATQVQELVFQVQYNDKVKIGEKYPDNYLPEWWLSKYFTTHKYANSFVYAIFSEGVIPLTKAFEHILTTHDIDTIIVVDGGIDSMMQGDEEGIGSFLQDIATLLTVSQLEIPTKLLITNAWGMEGHISHNQFFENVSNLTKTQDFYGCFFFTATSPEGKFYLEVLKDCFPENSTINIGIIDAMLGCSWQERSKWLEKRLESEKVEYENMEKLTLQNWFGCPLSGIYWFFNLEGVAKRLVYRDKIINSSELYDIVQGVHHYRYNQGLVDDDGQYQGTRKSEFF